MTLNDIATLNGNSFHTAQLNRKTILPRQTGNSLGCHIPVSWHLKSLVPVKVNPRLHWNQIFCPGLN